MLRESKKNSRVLVLVRFLVLAALVAAIAFSGKFDAFTKGHGLVFILAGMMFCALMGFNFKEMGAAFRHAAGGSGSSREIRTSSLFWESSARAAWVLGILASVIGFVQAFLEGPSSIAGIASRTALSLVPAVYGVILAIACTVPGWKLRSESGLPAEGDNPEDSENGAAKKDAVLNFESVLGYVLFIGMMAWIILGWAGYPQGVFTPWDWVFYWPSLLVVLGGTTVLVLFLGDGRAGTPFVIGFALAGLLGSLVGFVQALLGFAGKHVQQISAAVTFIISCCFVALLGMLLVGGPLEARWAKAGKKHGLLGFSRAAWYLLPVMTLIFLAITFIMVITPMKK